MCRTHGCVSALHVARWHATKVFNASSTEFHHNTFTTTGMCAHTAYHIYCTCIRRAPLHYITLYCSAARQHTPRCQHVRHRTVLCSALLYVTSHCVASTRDTRSSLVFLCSSRALRNSSFHHYLPGICTSWGSSMALPLHEVCRRSESGV